MDILLLAIEPLLSMIIAITAIVGLFMFVYSHSEEQFARYDFQVGDTIASYTV